VSSHCQLAQQAQREILQKGRLEVSVDDVYHRWAA